MNKRVVEEKMANADCVIQKLGKRKGDEYRQYRSKLSAFGAAVIMNGLLPAIGYYCSNEPTVIRLLKDMFLEDNPKEYMDNELAFFEYFRKKPSLEEYTELILNYSISLKLVLNMYISKE